MRKKLPRFATDRQAEDLIANADLTHYDLSGMTTVQFEFAPKTARINMRLPEDLLKAVKNTAVRRGVPYQRFIRQALERAVAPVASSRRKRRRTG